MERYGLRDLRDDDELIVATMTPEQLDELSEIAVLYGAGLLIPADDPRPLAVPIADIAAALDTVWMR